MDNAKLKDDITPEKPKDIMQQLDEGINAAVQQINSLKLDNYKLLTQLHKVNTQMMIIEDAVKMVKTLSEKEIEDWRVNHYKNDPIEKPLILTKDMEVKDNGHK